MPLDRFLSFSNSVISQAQCNAWGCVFGGWQHRGNLELRLNFARWTRFIDQSHSEDPCVLRARIGPDLEMWTSRSKSLRCCSRSSNTSKRVFEVFPSNGTNSLISRQLTSFVPPMGRPIVPGGTYTAWFWLNKFFYPVPYISGVLSGYAAFCFAAQNSDIFSIHGLYKFCCYSTSGASV